MTLSITEELQLTFALAAMRQQADHMRTARHWGLAGDVQQRATKIRKYENNDYANRYDTRVEVALRRLMHDAGSRDHRDYTPTGTATDRFSPEDLKRQAQREVRQTHERRMAKIDLAELRVLSSVVQQAARENAIRGLAVIDFARASKERGQNDGPLNSGPSRT